MQAPVAARFGIATLLGATLFTLLFMRHGLRIAGVLFTRQGWVLENGGLWMLGWWLWMAFLFTWMWTLTALIWHYLPAHRISAMLQSGLLLLGAPLSIAAMVVWMTVAPAVFAGSAASDWMPLWDALALGLLGAGLLMCGATTLWIGVDLLRLSPLPRAASVCCVVAGLATIPSPFLLPWPWHLLVAAVAWLAWSIYLAAQRRLPSRYGEMAFTHDS